MQNTELTFPAGTQDGDVQCLGIPLIDNNIADGNRYFTVSIVSFDPLVRVVPEYSQTFVVIEDNDGKPFVPHYTIHFHVVYNCKYSGTYDKGPT